jgi:hypothetical protein
MDPSQSSYDFGQPSKKGRLTFHKEGVVTAYAHRIISSRR